MRLTLRNLLNYMDHVLGPADASDIAKKVEESEFASTLMGRIRDVMRRARLGAPTASDRSAGLDPNTVAEYLDNTLPADRVQDFEKVCLESDVELSEVASCHQILTMVLGEPAEVDPASRERMYLLPRKAEALQEPAAVAGAAGAKPAAATTATVAAALAAAAAAGSRAGRPKAEVPSYLREPEKAPAPRPPRRPIWAALGVVAALAVVMAIAWWLSSPTIDGEGKSLSQADQQATDSAAAKTSTEPEAKPATQTAAEGKAAETPATTPAAEKTAAPEARPATPPKAVAAASPAAPSTATPPPPPAPPTATPSEKPTDAASPAAKPSATAATIPAASMGAGPGKPSPLPPPPAGDLAAPPKPVGPPAAAGQPAPGTALAKADVKPGVAVAKPGAPTSTKPDAAPLPPERMGRFILEKQVLLQYDSSVGWQRVPTRAFVTSGVPLLVLPGWQAMIELNAGATLEMRGGTQVQLFVAQGGAAGIRLDFGRVLVHPVGAPKQPFALRFGSRSGAIAFRDPDSIVGVEVRCQRPQAIDPESSECARQALIYVPSGGVVWAEAGQAPVTVSAPTLLRMAEQGPGTPQAIQDLPRWLSADETTILDRQAATALEQVLPPERPIALSLGEQAEVASQRRKEVAALAMRGLSYIGQFDSAVTVLNSADQTRYWTDALQALSGAVSRGPTSAAAVRQALEKRYPQEAAILYPLLWVYNGEDLPAAQLEHISRQLDHETLAVRVVAAHTLEQAGKFTFTSYRPSDPAPKRQTAAVRWRERLQSAGAGKSVEPKRPPSAAELPPARP